MQSVFWPDWAKILEQRGLRSLACIVLDRARPLFVMLAQVLLVATPLLRGLSAAPQLSALAETLGDADALSRFTAYLHEETV
jgi:hypothetical protein